MEPEVTPKVEDWGVFAWISARWTEVVTTALNGCARWTADFADSFLPEQDRRNRPLTYQVSDSNCGISDLYIQLGLIA